MSDTSYPFPETYLKTPMPKRVDKNTFTEQMLREDWTFLRRMLAPLHITEKQTVKRQYRIEFVKAFNAEPSLHRKGNAGRRAANLYLFNWYESQAKKTPAC